MTRLTILLPLALILGGCFDDGFTPDEDTCEPDQYWVGRSLSAEVAWDGDRHLVHWVPGDGTGAQVAPVEPDSTVGSTQTAPESTLARLVATERGTFQLIRASRESTRGIQTIALDAAGRPKSDWRTIATWSERLYGPDGLAATFDGEAVWVAAAHDGERSRTAVRLAHASADGLPIDDRLPLVVGELFEGSVASVDVARVGDVLWIVWGRSIFDNDLGWRRVVDGSRVAVDGTILERETRLLDDARGPHLATRGNQVLLVATSSAGGVTSRRLGDSGPLSAPVQTAELEGTVLELVPTAEEPGYLVLTRTGQTEPYPCPDCTIRLTAMSDGGTANQAPLLALPAVDAALSAHAGGYLLATVTEEADGDSGTTRLLVQTMTPTGQLGDATELGQSRATFEQIVCD